MARDRRRAVTTLAEDLPEGPEGQPAHKAGAEVVLIHLVEVDEVGNVATPVAAPSALLRDAAEAHVKRAAKSRARVPSQTKTAEWSQPGYEVTMTNTTLMLDCFQETMAAATLLRAAVDAWSVEQLPVAVWTDQSGREWDRAAIESNMGTERRLTQVLPALTGSANVAEANPDMWAHLQRLKTLRDKVAHVHNDEIYARTSSDAGPAIDPADTVFSFLLRADVMSLSRAVDDLFQTVKTTS
jgi:hypothetical protein